MVDAAESAPKRRPFHSVMRNGRRAGLSASVQIVQSTVPLADCRPAIYSVGDESQRLLRECDSWARAFNLMGLIAAGFSR